MEKPRSITHEQFKDAVRRLLLKKPSPDAVSDDYEPTPQDLDEVFHIGTKQSSHPPPVRSRTGGG